MTTHLENFFFPHRDSNSGLYLFISKWFFNISTVSWSEFQSKECAFVAEWKHVYLYVCATAAMTVRPVNNARSVACTRTSAVWWIWSHFAGAGGLLGSVARRPTGGERQRDTLRSPGQICSLSARGGRTPTRRTNWRMFNIKTAANSSTFIGLKTRRKNARLIPSRNRQMSCSAVIFRDVYFFTRRPPYFGWHKSWIRQHFAFAGVASAPVLSGFNPKWMPLTKKETGADFVNSKISLCSFRQFIQSTENTRVFS